MWSAYTDGSSSPNPGPGGAGAVILHDGVPVIELVHAGGKTTNNRMELHALIMTFPHLPKHEPVTLYTDSEYVQKGLSQWLSGWIQRNWMTATNKPVANVQQWKELHQLHQEYPNVTIKWVKAHNGNEWNERADYLANQGTAQSKQM